MSIKASIMTALIVVGLPAAVMALSPADLQHSEQNIAQRIRRDRYCPRTAEDLIDGRVTQDAFFETEDYDVFICRQDRTDKLYYYSESRNFQGPYSYTLVPIDSLQIEYVARNGSTVYRVNPTTLQMTNNGMLLLHQAVTRSSNSLHP